ncbi:uncharacterized protein PFL1_04603 [Pseudozyma flocculosa PF-1]|uniref:Related to YBT1 - Vacuolar, full-size ABC protein transporting bile acids n=2 Tax=Pseudozyma flocculosa TaxID=84751 RepID=A0A5C3F9B6_9BASI|nr:uncharacterized protein PFL1_04603 [Pseudozyma flocculosa PF-1]EPQ27859.1 hypothetical protein PFL1_04603 [Pseudozyma flocculosa PF-1]SPO41012.1 related to YBT1 - Vacuolar, full-size ABC protein transporting bile acids [Pseudozyma flocculosa]
MSALPSRSVPWLPSNNGEALPYLYQVWQPGAPSSSRHTLDDPAPAPIWTSSALAHPMVASLEQHQLDWQRTLALLRIVPAGLVALRAIVHLVARAHRRSKVALPSSSKRKSKQRARDAPSPSKSGVFAYFAPFVTQDDVDQLRRQRTDVADSAASEDDDDDGRRFDKTRFDGFRKQRRRIVKLAAVGVVEALAWMVQLGWQLGSSDDPVGLFNPVTTLCLSAGWIYVAASLAARPPQTPPVTVLAILIALAVSATAGLLSFIPSIVAAFTSGSLDPLNIEPLVFSLADTAVCAYALRQVLSMPIAPGGFEAQVDLDERLRIQSGEVVQDPSGERPLADTYRLCPTSPEDYCTLYENLSYSWMAPIQKLALKRSLGPTDVWKLRSINDTRLLFQKFKALDRLFGDAADPVSTSSQPAVVGTEARRHPGLLAKILRANANDILLDACFKLVSVSFAYLGTFIMKSILTEIQIAASMEGGTANDDGGRHGRGGATPTTGQAWTPRQKAFVYATIGLALTVVRFLAELQNYHHARQVGLRLRSTLVVSMFEKALKRRDLSGLTRPTKSDAARRGAEPAQTESGAASQPTSASASPTIAQGSPEVGSDGGDGDGDEAVRGPQQDGRHLGVPRGATRGSQTPSVGESAGLARKRSWTDSLRSLTLRRPLSLSSIAHSLRSGRSARQSKDAAAAEERRRAAELQREEEERGADIGKVVNMMASDINVLLRMGCDLHQLYGAPFEVTIATVFLYKLMGWSALVGFSILVAAIPLNYFWGEAAVRRQREYSSARDERMNLMTELISAMRFVKIQGIEGRWEQRVREARRNEIRKLIWSRLMSFLFELLWTTVPVLVTLISFFFYVKVAGHELTVAVAFTAIALFTMIRPPLNAIPGFLMGGLIALVSVKRLEGFLSEEEVDATVSALSRGYGEGFKAKRSGADESTGAEAEAEPTVEDDDAASELAIANGSFKWHVRRVAVVGDGGAASPDPNVRSADIGGDAFELRNLSVSFPAQKLSVVLGPTGSGKSSLLSALLGEMLETSQGAVRRSKFDARGRSRISFAGQLPWLEAGKTVRENITFVTPWDPERYRLCVHACALDDDIAAMDDGDQTRIGAHTVSGGQKARISLARALYARSDTVLLDDVLSAVDTRVQNHLARHALTGDIARGRRIVLVTHHAHLVADQAELMVYMRSGRIEALGSPAKLRQLGLIAAHRSGGGGEEEEEGGGADEAGTVDPGSGDGSDNAASPPAGHSDATKPAEVGDAGRTPGTRTPRLLYEAEKRRQGAVSWVFYKTYLQASKMSIWLCLILFLLLLRLASSFEQYWLKVWGEAYRPESVAAAAGVRFPPAAGHSTFYLGVYGLTGLSIVVFNSARAICFYTASIRASQNLFTSLLSNVIGAPLRWFDTNPTGRILNRFGTDMDGIDNVMPQAIMNLLGNSFAMAAYVAICLAIVPAFVVPLLVLAAAGPWLVGGFLASTRDMQRIEATSTSPLYGLFEQALAGIVTIRAFGAEPQVLESLLDAVDLYQSLWWAVCTMEVWLSFRSQILGGVAVFVVTLLALSGAVSPGSAGLALSSAQLLCQLAYYLVNDFKNISTSFNSLERVAEYQTMPREETNEVAARYRPSLPPAGWPSRRATIAFEDVSLRYAPELPEVLKRVSFVVQPGEKIGVIGRTGSGKSSLASSLFRATELSGGRIVIDGIDIQTIRLHDLRSRLSIVMQDPVLFSGTIRDNLDPFGEYGDDEILAAMRKVNIAAPAASAGDEDGGGGVRTAKLVDVEGADESRGHDDAADQDRARNDAGIRLTLDTPVSSGGANFSAGQAQLISLARSLLRSSRILILDEATSSTDMATDAMIQRAIRTQLSECIVICVAHRLRSIIDYDRVLVMQDGRVVEFGRPKELLEKDDGDKSALFKDLCRQSSEYESLREAAGLSGA